MDAYLFLQTAPGTARQVMRSLVDSGAAAAVAVTGRYDVIARVEDVSPDDLAGLVCDRLGGVEGVSASTTAVVVPEEAMALDFRLPPLPFRALPAGLVGLVLATVEPGSATEVLAMLTRTKGLLGLAVLTGDEDLLIEVSGDDITGLARKVLDDVQTVAGIRSTSTLLVLASEGGSASTA